MKIKATRTITNIQKENIESKWGEMLKKEIEKHRQAVAVANRRYSLLSTKASPYMKQYLK